MFLNGILFDGILIYVIVLNGILFDGIIYLALCFVPFFKKGNFVGIILTDAGKPAEYLMETPEHAPFPPTDVVNRRFASTNSFHGLRP